MKNITILKVYFSIYLVSCLILMLANWELIANKELHTILFYVEWLVLALLGLLVDFILIKIISNKKIFNGIELLILVGFTIIFWSQL